MANPTKTPTSHGHGGETHPKRVAEHKSYGGRDEVGGGPAGRGNDGAVTTDTERDWARGDEQEGNDGIPEAQKPVAGAKNPKNVFSK
jgi:hypothetical protein